MERGCNRGETWEDLRLNDMIVSQSRAMPNEQEREDLPGWMKGMMRKMNEPEVRMVTGERAIQFARCSTLAMHKALRKERRRTDRLMDQFAEFGALRGQVQELQAKNHDLSSRVSRLERRAARLREAAESSRDGGSRRPRSMRDSRAGSPRDDEELRRFHWSPSPLRGLRRAPMRFVGQGTDENPFIDVELLTELPEVMAPPSYPVAVPEGAPEFVAPPDFDE